MGAWGSDVEMGRLALHVGTKVGRKAWSRRETPSQHLSSGYVARIVPLLNMGRDAVQFHTSPPTKNFPPGKSECGPNDNVRNRDHEAEQPPGS